MTDLCILALEIKWVLHKVLWVSILIFQAISNNKNGKFWNHSSLRHIRVANNYIKVRKITVWQSFATRTFFVLKIWFCFAVITWTRWRPACSATGRAGPFLGAPAVLPALTSRRLNRLWVDTARRGLRLWAPSAALPEGEPRVGPGSPASRQPLSWKRCWASARSCFTYFFAYR